MNTPPASRLGIDFGNVIQGSGAPGEDDTPFIGASVEEAMKAPPLPGALEGVRALVERFDRRVWIVSKAGATMQRKTLAWLAHHDWWRLTGMEPWSIAFVLHREQKREVARVLKLTHFIDDRSDVLVALDEHDGDPFRVPNLYWFGQTDGKGFVAMPDWTHVGLVT